MRFYCRVAAVFIYEEFARVYVHSCRRIPYLPIPTHRLSIEAGRQNQEAAVSHLAISISISTRQNTFSVADLGVTIGRHGKFSES
jgi:hypothetical protein